ncbi:uncharacterized protein LOC124556307 [Schistocerca americana]|uniref:uncharacterized protein LOC124556307 n=1 Tax=Schistocerca americana TaxID=7009 RepID=UPI001F502B1F|nr:uncharacterized protein LOC124556307 [Schistocerca americana]XP_049954742.1 uncharacterized protein LOC126470777 [Schistocerca serialis cubense]
MRAAAPNDRYLTGHAPSPNRPPPSAFSGVSPQRRDVPLLSGAYFHARSQRHQQIPPVSRIEYERRFGCRLRRKARSERQPSLNAAVLSNLGLEETMNVCRGCQNAP